MEIQEDEKIYILTPLSPKIDKSESHKIFTNLNTEKKIALDLSYVSDCTIDFIDAIKNFSSKKAIGIFNISSDIFSLFNVLKIDKYADLFVSKIDFIENTRQLIFRDFTIVRSDN